MKTPDSATKSKRGNWLTFLVCLFVVQVSFAQTASIVPIPTLGGTESTPFAVNASGQVVGSSLLAGNTAEHAFLFSGGVIYDLQTLGGMNSYAMAINNQGQVAGYSDTVSGRAAFLFTGSSMLNLNTIEGASSEGLQLNEAGQVAGNLLTAQGQSVFLYSQGQMLDLLGLGGTYSRPFAMNASGWVAGESELATGEIHATLWKNGSLVDLGTLGGVYSTVYDMNDAGWVVGYSTLADKWTVHAFLADETGIRDLGALSPEPGSGSYAIAVNNKGQVAGDGDAPNWEYHGFIWADNRLQDLGTLGGGYSFVFDMNNSGQVVGYSLTDAGEWHAFLWENGTIKDLNSLIPADSGWTLEMAYNISDGGHIIGTGWLNYQPVWFLLTLPQTSGNSPPVANAGLDQVLECRGAQTVAVLDGTGSSDPDGDALNYEWFYAGTVLGSGPTLSVAFGLGDYTVTLKVTDPSGASAEDTVQVQVRDTTPPAIQSATATPSALFPAAHQMVPVTVTVSVLDNCDAAPTARIISITSSDPVTGKGDNTSPDWEITGGLTANLRSESKQTRFYTLLVQCTDASGNASQATVIVHVDGKTKVETTTAKIPQSQAKAKQGTLVKTKTK